MLNEIGILKDLSVKLEKENIPYMLTGSLAMSFYAQPRMTRDIDIVINLKSDDVRRVIDVFSNDYYVSEDAVFDAITRKSMFNLIHNSSVVKIDFIIRKNTDYRIEEFNRRNKVRIFDFDIYIVSKEDLILSKMLWSKDSRSEMQFRDIKNLVLTGYDSKYLEQWIDKLNLKELWDYLGAKKDE